MQAEFTLHDTLIILCYLGRDPDHEIALQARKNLIPAARTWYSRPDRPKLPDPIYEIVMKVIDKVGLGEKEEALSPEDEIVHGNIGLLGLAEIIQAIDHNSRTVCITLQRNGDTVDVYTENGKVVGAVTREHDGLEALYHAFSWVYASFRYTHVPPGPFRNMIKANTLTLVMDGLEHTPDEDPFQNDVSWTWKIEGHLRIMNIFEIAEIFEMNSKQAICVLSREGEEGCLYFKNGRICNASLRDMAGMDAACHLLAWPNARFRITRGGEEATEVIHVGMQNLIIEAMRLLDEGVTVTDKIASEIGMINELFEGRDLVTLPVLEKVRLVFSEDERARETLETDANPLVRKAIKVKISKTVHKYLSPSTDRDIRLKAAQGKVPLSTTEKLVVLSYLSHDEVPEIKDTARRTLEALDMPTYRKGFDADLHPSVMDFLVRETIRDPSLLRVACSADNVMEETALYILENFPSTDTLQAVMDNKKLLERGPVVSARLAELVRNDPARKQQIDAFEESMLQGQTDLKVEGTLSLCGLAGLARAARQGARSGTIVVEALGRSGRLFFSRGKVIGAVAGELEGLQALEGILRWPESKFRYVLRTHYHTENIDPAAAEDLLNTIAAQPSAQEAESGRLRLISGSLDAMDIFESLTALEGTPVPVIISIIAEEGSGEIYRNRAHVLHAHVDGKESPMEAMAAMLSWNCKRIIIRLAPAEFPTTMNKPLSDFFTEAMHLLPDEIMRATRPGELPEWELSEAEYESLFHQIAQMGVAEKVKLAFMGGKEARGILVRDPIRMVAVAVVKSPKIREDEIEAISKSRNVCDEVLRQIAQTKEWVKNYKIKLNLAENSKTPVPLAMRFLSHLREQDLRKIARSKNVASMIATQARRMADQKTGH